QSQLRPYNRAYAYRGLIASAFSLPWRSAEENSYEGKASFLLERYPVDPNSGYTRQQVWVDQARFIPLKIEYYDRKNALLKTLVFRGYQQYLDQYWRADQMYMENHQTGKSTLLSWEKYDFRSGLSDGDFNKNSLKRAR
ncbi:MAG: outer membrane lipoprotein-sorting protein, partial [Candidatus Thiodiazotropha sp. (ex Gloverina cf. vestifex)]|nr:outer membrane lipoprotein-sorting protein [Candidatus Thiodiazotropha sp. (ex Gloverina cf. vestifex)]